MHKSLCTLWVTCYYIHFWWNWTCPFPGLVGIWTSCVGHLLKGSEDASGITGGNNLYPLIQSLDGIVEGQKIFLQQERDVCPLIQESHTPGPLTHHWLLQSVEPVFTAGSWVLNSPPLLFIVPLIALNAAAFLVRLARLWKLSRGYFVIKFTVMSSGGTGSVKFEITSGHF